MRWVEEACGDSERSKLLWERILVARFRLHSLREGRGVIESIVIMFRKRY